MRTFIKTSLVIMALGLTTVGEAQNATFGNMQNLIPRDQRAINQFDVKKDTK